MSQNGGTHVPPQYSSQPHPEPFSAHTHHCEPPTDPIMEYEPTPSNIPDQRVELSPQRHGHIHLPEAEPVQQGQGHISRSALNGNLRLSQEQQKKRPVNDRNATNGSMVPKSAIQCKNEGVSNNPKLVGQRHRREPLAMILLWLPQNLENRMRQIYQYKMLFQLQVKTYNIGI